MITATQYPIKVLRKSWPVFGQRIMPGFVPDEISAITSTFFSDLRADKWKSLQREPQKGLLLAGHKGVGKTINFRIYSKIISNDPNKNRHPKVVSVLEIQENYKKEQQNGKGADYMDSLAKYPELIIDDIGSEDVKFNDYGTVRNLIADLLMLRYPLFQRGVVITHGTTNFNKDTLAEIYDARLLDRMKEMFVFQIVMGESKRTEPTKRVSEVQQPEPEKTPVESRRIYLEGFMESLTIEGRVTFYDKGPMWNFLVNNGKIDPAELEDFDMKAQAIKREEVTYNNLTQAKSYIDVNTIKQSYDRDFEVEKELKHLILQRYFSNYEINLNTFTDEQIML